MSPREARPPGTIPQRRRRSAYEEHTAEWERHRAATAQGTASPDGAGLGGGDWLTDDHTPFVDAGQFLKHLRLLGYQTQNRHLLEAHTALIRNGIAVLNGDGDDRHWEWDRDKLSFSNPLTVEICEWLDGAIASGTSKRVAFAEVTAKMHLAAPDFDAAVKRVDRLWRAWQAYKPRA